MTRISFANTPSDAVRYDTAEYCDARNDNDVLTVAARRAAQRDREYIKANVRHIAEIVEHMEHMHTYITALRGHTLSEVEITTCQERLTDVSLAHILLHIEQSNQCAWTNRGEYFTALRREYIRRVREAMTHRHA